MTFIKKYCFTCQTSYLVDEAHPHRCIMEDDRREFTLAEIRVVIREEVRNALRLTPSTRWALPADIPRKACDGDIGWSALCEDEGCEHYGTAHVCYGHVESTSSDRTASPSAL